MKIKLQNLDRLYQELQSGLEASVRDVYKSGRHLLGPFTSKLESRIAKLSQAKHCVMVGSGSDALYYGLVASATRYDQRISYPAQTFIATKNSITRSKNIPIGVDVKPNGLLDWSLVNTDSAVWVGLFGNTEDLPIDKIIYEDGAQHFGLPLRGQFASYSFDPTKALSNFGNAGAVVTNDSAIADSVRELRRHGGGVDGVGGNSIPSERDCAELLVKLDHFPFWQERRQEIARDYHQQLGHLVDCVTQHTGQVSKFVISTPLRVELEMWLIRREVQTKRVYEKPLYMSRQATENCLTQLALPCDPYMTDKELQVVILAVKEFFKELPFKRSL
mgnify:FL=1